MTEEGVAEAISDTGPVLHLHEIACLPALGVFRHISIPDLVAAELLDRGVDPSTVDIPGLALQVLPVPSEVWRPLVHADGSPAIQPADAQVLALARSHGSPCPVLTDDQVLRRRLEADGTTVVGSVGILVRAYRTGRMRRDELERAVDALFARSTLHLSRAFRAYVRRLVAALS